MSRGFRSLLFATCVVLTPLCASAQVTPAAGYTPPDDTQAIKIGAVVFWDYTRTSSPKVNDAAGNPFSPSVFNVARTYLNVTGNISHNIAFRITPDITRDTTTGSSTNGSLLVRLKYGYAQINLDDWTGNWKQSYVRLGIQQTPFIDAQESVYRYRFQGTVFVERDGGLSSADAGATFHTNLPNNYGDFHVGIYNGEGYNRVEVNQEKALMVRGTIRPLPAGGFLTKGLRVTGFYIGDHAVKNADKTRGVGSIFYEHKRLNAGLDYITLTDQALPTSTKVKADGWSVFLTPFFKEKGNGFEALLRFDNFKPNKTNNDQIRRRSIVGVSYWFPHPTGTATAAIMLDFERVKFDGFPDTPANATQRRIALHGLINF